jgi:hypothetical protein
VHANERFRGLDGLLGQLEQLHLDRDFPPYVLTGDRPAEVRDGQASTGTSRYLTRLARAESRRTSPATAWLNG